VYALAVSGGTVYVGGYFTSMGSFPYGGLVAVSAATGIPTGWRWGAYTHALAVSGQTVYAGGSSFLVALDASTANLNWSSSPSNLVLSLALGDGVLYVGGMFSSIGGQPRSRLAALNAATGDVTAWDPNPNERVDALAVDGGTVYAGGQFGGIGGQARPFVAAIDAGTGLATPWNAGADAGVRALAVGGGSTCA
jgi:outer membrane protein assembly factor BamB